jgi:magnesium-transporting ATPase (P-type)
MERPPRDPKESLLDRTMTWKVFYATTALVATMLGAMQWTVNSPTNGSIAEGRATAMTTLTLGQCFFALNCRFQSRSSVTPAVLIGNWWMYPAIVVNMLIQVILIYVPGVNVSARVLYPRPCNCKIIDHCFMCRPCGVWPH